MYILAPESIELSHTLCVLNTNKSVTENYELPLNEKKKSVD